MRLMAGIFMAVALAGLCASPLGAQPSSDSDIYWKIRREATDNSQILSTLHMFTDRYGPRLTGSPNLRAAGEWAVEQMTAWGLTNGHLEPWEFGHPGWTNERLSAHLISPVSDVLTAEVLAWTPATDGALRAEVTRIASAPDKPTDEELVSYFETIRGQLTGKIVLVGEHRSVPVAFNPSMKRRDDSQVASAYDPDNPVPFFRPRRRGGDEDDDRLDRREVDKRLNAFLAEQGVAVAIRDAGRLHGQIRAFSNRSYDEKLAPPTLILRNEDFGRIARLKNDGPVELEIDIQNRFYPEGKTSYNVIAEIPGTDLAEEVVMLGGHLDSWHAATGATDNAIGCAVMMEAARILSAIGVEPRRTIRVALWSGEEQGLLGSKAYVAEHFGTAEEPKPEHEHFAGYFNIDSGTGRARGMTVFGPSEAAAILRTALKSFEDLGVMGATTTKSRRRGGSDHTSFNAAGLPGIGVGQDPIEYGSHSWHTNLDTYERVVVGDAVNSAIAIASAVYHVAMRDEKLPRFTAENMPEPVKEENEAEAEKKKKDKKPPTSSKPN